MNAKELCRNKNQGGVKLLIINNLQKQDFLQNFNHNPAFFTHSPSEREPGKSAKGLISLSSKERTRVRASS